MDYLRALFIGALLCNAIPHIVAGLQGNPFPTPFAKPSGIGNSSPLINFLWGAANLLFAVYLIAQHPSALQTIDIAATGIAGFVAGGAWTSHHFGKVMRNRKAAPAVSPAAEG